VYEPSQTFDEFREVDIRTSRLQRIPAFRRNPRLALPVLPWAWSRTQVEDADVVVASSTGWAHGIGTHPDCRRLVYCHNPARWLYQADDYAGRAPERLLLRAVHRPLKAWDRAAASKASLYLANSAIVARRIREAYGREAEVLHPPVTVDTSAPQQPVPSLEPGFWLTVARRRGYKNTAVVIEGVRTLRDNRLVVVGDSSAVTGQPHVTALGVVPEQQLRWLYTNARALVSVSFEDFGLTPLEANAFGTPVAVLRAGGFLDSTVEGVSGVFIEEATPEAVRVALRNFPALDAAGVRANAGRFSERSFAAELRRHVMEVAGMDAPS
jgi:glycosyltransferase involved in cell wall biosynthesis